MATWRFQAWKKRATGCDCGRQETVKEGPHLRTLRTTLMGLSPRNRWALVLEEVIGLGIYPYPSHSLKTSGSCSYSYFVGDCLLLLREGFPDIISRALVLILLTQKQEGSSLWGSRVTRSCGGRTLLSMVLSLIVCYAHHCNSLASGFLNIETPIIVILMPFSAPLQSVQGRWTFATTTQTLCTDSGHLNGLCLSISWLATQN